MECSVHGWIARPGAWGGARPDPGAPEVLLLGAPVDVSALGLPWNAHSVPMSSLMSAGASGDAGARRAAAMGLRILRNRDALPAMRQMLSDPDEYVRKQAAWALGELGDPADMALLRPLLADPALRVRLFAAFALARLGDPEGARLTAAEVQDTTDEPIRRGEGAIALADGRHGQYRPLLEQLLAAGGDRLLVSRLRTALSRPM